MDKKLISNIINGYKAAGRFIETEQINELKQLIPSQSLKIFLSLCTTNINLSDNNLDSLKIGYLIKRRNALNVLGKKIDNPGIIQLFEHPFSKITDKP